MKRHHIKTLVDKFTGYWIYKSRHLPIGADLKIDITRRLGYADVRTVFDVGANRGQSYAAFRRDYPDAFIYCFEPVAETFAVLSRITGEDGKAKAELLAFGDDVGQKQIRLFEKASDLNSLRDDLMNNMRGAREEIVRIDTIDNYCARSSITTIDLLKIDTEGYEIKVLSGATKSLETASIVFLLCEVGFVSSNTRNTIFSEVAELLSEYHYRFVGLYDVSHYWKDGISFGNALFVHESIVV